MNIVVFGKLVPDLVEELTIDASGTAIDTAWLRLTINEFDDYAIEQAILLKEAGSGKVTVITPNFEGVDDMLFAASARGVDRLIKLNGDFESGVNNHAMARAIAPLIKEIQPDLVMTGVQAHNDLDGSLGPLLAEYVDIPFVGYVAGVKHEGDKVVVRKEYPGGLIGEMEVALPALLGIQAAEQPPRPAPPRRLAGAARRVAAGARGRGAFGPGAGGEASRPGTRRRHLPRRRRGAVARHDAPARHVRRGRRQRRRDRLRRCALRAPPRR